MDAHVIQSMLDTIEVQSSQIETLERRLAALQSELAVKPRIAALRAGVIGGERRYEPVAVRSDGGRDLAHWPRYAAEPAPLEPNPGWSSFGMKTRRLPVVGFGVCGFEPAGLEAVVGTVERSQRTQRNFVPLFVTDCTAFEIFRRRGYVFEYLPPASERDRLSGGEAWDERLTRRLATIKAKWGLVRLVKMGPHGLPFASLAPAAAPRLEER